MRQSKPILFGAICIGLILPRFMIAAETSTPREMLAQYVAELQKAPEDQALRERIIRLELTLAPLPAVPEVAQQLFSKATFFEREAGSMQGNDALALSARGFAISSYKEALLIAPWWPEAYYGLSTSLEASGRLNEAVTALNLYVVTRPNSVGASDAEERLRAIAAKRDRARP